MWEMSAFYTSSLSGNIHGPFPLIELFYVVTCDLPKVILLSQENVLEPFQSLGTDIVIGTTAEQLLLKAVNFAVINTETLDVICSSL